MKEQDYYRVLGVKREATPAQIKAAYRKQAKMHHPDNFAAAPPEERNAHEQQMRRANEAYECLSDPEDRAYYDRHGCSEKTARTNRAAMPLTPVEEAILNVFSSIYNPVSQDATRTDYAVTMRRHAREKMREHGDEIQRLNTAIASMEKLKGRMTKEGEPIEVFEAMVLHQLTAAKAAKDKAEEEFKLWQDVAKELASWKWKVDIEGEQSIFGHLGAGAWPSATFRITTA